MGEFFKIFLLTFVLSLCVSELFCADAIPNVETTTKAAGFFSKLKSSVKSAFGGNKESTVTPQASTTPTTTTTKPVVPQNVANRPEFPTPPPRNRPDPKNVPSAALSYPNAPQNWVPPAKPVGPTPPFPKPVGPAGSPQMGPPVPALKPVGATGPIGSPQTGAREPFPALKPVGATGSPQMGAREPFPALKPVGATGLPQMGAREPFPALKPVGATGSPQMGAREPFPALKPVGAPQTKPRDPFPPLKPIGSPQPRDPFPALKPVGSNGPQIPALNPIGPTGGSQPAPSYAKAASVVTTTTLKPEEGPGGLVTQERAGVQDTGPTDDELREFSEKLLAKDTNNAFKYVTLNVQGKTTSQSKNDEAPNRLLEIQDAAYKIPTIEKLTPLYNNYIVDSAENEFVSPQEKQEENDLLDTMISTPVMQLTKNLLIEKGKLSKDPKDFKELLKQIWFNLYSRGGGKIGSSGFEHIFLTETKKGEISGLHNWLFFSLVEKSNQANYLGHMRVVDLGQKGAILKFHFKYFDLDKPVATMFVGTSPELEMAMYTTCFMFRANRICPMQMNGKRFVVRTYTYRYRSKNLIGSAYPEI